MKHPIKPIQTYGPERQQHIKNHFTKWYDSDIQNPLLYNDVMGGGKTYSIGCKDGFIHLITQVQSDTEWGVIDVPRVENMSDPTLRDGLGRLTLILGRVVKVVSTEPEFRSELSQKRIQKNDDLIVLLNNTSYFCGGTVKKDNSIIDIIQNYGFKDQGFFIQDEFHKGMNKNVGETKKNMGWEGDSTKMKFVRYKMGQKFLGVTRFVIGLSATPLATMIEDWNSFQDGSIKESDFYIIPKLKKDKRLVKTSVIDNFYNYDYTTDESPRRVLQDFVVTILNKNTTIDYIMGKYNLKISPIKTTGLIKINRRNSHVDIKTLEFMFNSIDVNKSFQWGYTTYEGIKLFQYDSVKKESTQIENTYNSDQELLNDMDDHNHPLRFLGVIEKGSLGINIKYLYGVLSYRQPTTYDNDGNAVINNTVQYCGRAIRLKIMYEDLLECMKNQSNINFGVDEVNKIWCELNSSIFFLPNDDFHKKVESFLRQDYYDTWEIYPKLSELNGI